MISANEAELVTPHEAAAILKINYRAVLDLIAVGNLRAIRIGRQYRIRSADLNRFIESSVFEPAVSNNPGKPGF